MPLHSLLVIRHGRVVLDAAFWPYDGRTPHDIASVTKSIVATLAGRALSEGFGVPLDRPLVTTGITDWPTTFDRRLTLAHLLSMSSGFDCAGGDDARALRQLRASGDWYRSVAQSPQVARPGTAFRYCSAATHLAAGVLDRSVPGGLATFAQRQLWTPLGMAPPLWPADPQGVPHGWGDLRLDPHDLARLGLLYLRDGRWRDRRLLAAGYVRRATSNEAPRRGTPSDVDYGLGWWRLRAPYAGIFEARGRGGQFLTVWPKRDLIVVMTGAGYDRQPIVRRLLEAQRASGAPLHADPVADSALETSIRTAAQPPARCASPPARESSQSSASGAMRYAFPGNVAGIATIGWATRSAAELAVTLELVAPSSPAPGRYELAAGLDDCPRVTAGGPLGMPVTLQAHRDVDAGLEIEYADVAGPTRLTLRITPGEFDAASLHVTDHTGAFGGDFTVAGRKVDGTDQASGP